MVQSPSCYDAQERRHIGFLCCIPKESYCRIERSSRPSAKPVSRLQSHVTCVHIICPHINSCLLGCLCIMADYLSVDWQVKVLGCLRHRPCLCPCPFLCPWPGQCSYFCSCFCPCLCPCLCLCPYPLPCPGLCLSLAPRSCLCPCPNCPCLCPCQKATLARLLHQVFLHGNSSKK